MARSLSRLHASRLACWECCKSRLESKPFKHNIQTTIYADIYVCVLVHLKKNLILHKHAIFLASHLLHFLWLWLSSKPKIQSAKTDVLSTNVWHLNISMLPGWAPLAWISASSVATPWPVVLRGRNGSPGLYNGIQVISLLGSGSLIFILTTAHRFSRG